MFSFVHVSRFQLITIKPISFIMFTGFGVHDAMKTYNDLRESTLRACTCVSVYQGTDSLPGSINYL